LYDGKESIFWTAQQLSYDDTPMTNLKSAFTRLVSGVTDLKDVKDGGDVTRRIVLQEMSNRVEENLALRKDKRTLLTIIEQNAQRTGENSTFFSKVEGLNALALSPEDAIQGFYIVTKPRLGLARVAQKNGVPVV
jgi:hypothetical protein